MPVLKGSIFGYNISSRVFPASLVVDIFLGKKDFPVIKYRGTVTRALDESEVNCLNNDEDNEK